MSISNPRIQPKHEIIYTNDPVQHCVGILQRKLLYNFPSPVFLPNQIRLILFYLLYKLWMLHHFLQVFYLRIVASGKTAEYFYIPNHDLKMDHFVWKWIILPYDLRWVHFCWYHFWWAEVAHLIFHRPWYYIQIDKNLMQSFVAFSGYISERPRSTVDLGNVNHGYTV